MTPIRQAEPGPFHLTGRDTAWLVESGSVDVFLELLSPTHGDGPRRHLFRVEAGGALFGLAGDGSRPYPVIVVPVPGAALVSLERAAVPARRIERWIEQMTATVAEEVLPKRFVALEPGAETAPDNQPVSPRAGVVWVRVVEGSARFLGDAALAPVEGGATFPVCARAWLDPAGVARFAAFSTPEFLTTADAWASLDGFHERVRARLVDMAAREEALERARAQKRSYVDAKRMDSALRGLAAPLDQTVRLPGGSSNDAWLAACHAVGDCIGVIFSRPPDRTADLREPLAAIAEFSRVRYRQVVLAAGWWQSEHGPLVAQREGDGAPVALLPAGRGYECFDPATGRRRRVDEKLAATLEPFAWSFYPPFPLEPVRLGGLLRFALRGSRRELSMIVLGGAGAAAAAMAVPVATGYIFDTLIPGADHSGLSLIAILLLATALCSSLFEMVRGFALLRLEGNMDTYVQAAVWDRLLELPTSFFRRYSAGDLANRGLGIQTMRQVLTGSVVTSMLSGIFSLSSFVLLFYYSSKMALAAAGLTAMAFGFVAVCGFWQARLQSHMAEARGKLSGLLLQLVGGVTKIRISAAEPRAFAAWASRFAELRTVSIASRAVTNRIAVFNAFWPVVCSLLLFALYAKDIETAPAGATPMTTGELVAFLAAFAQLLQAALGFAAALISVIAVAPAYERARPILESVPEDWGTRGLPGDLTGDIEVRHVSFRYSDDSPPILRDVSLSIRPGQFVAIAGPSGSGKSTLFRMLLGFEKPDSGAIYYDQQDLANLDTRAVRRQIGVVLQNGRIRAGSILQNIAGALRLTIDDAWEAARMAGFDADIESMPMGMQTVLGEGGGTLSGGQRQRLLIARALARRPRIIFFDEATSALDNQTQAIVSRSLDNLRATRVVIAHRLSTIEKADLIYMVVGGQVVEEGSYMELISRGGPFAELAKRQIT